MIEHRLVDEQRQTSFGCPEQYEGRLIDGEYFYFRYRHGWASLGVGNDWREAIEDPNRAGVQHGDHLQGIFDDDEDRNRIFAELLTKRLRLFANTRWRP